MAIEEGALMWEPTAESRERSNLSRFRRWVEERGGRPYPDYGALWRWSIEQPEEFWESIWGFFEIESSSPYTAVLSGAMPDVEWFSGARLNFARHVFRNADRLRPAIIHRSEARAGGEWSWAELSSRASDFAAALRAAGVGPGDRVAAYLPNIPEAVAAFLGAASIGAVWSSCAPDFGAQSAIDRFSQIEPKVLVAVDGYRYGGRAYDRMETVRLMREALPSLKKVLVVPYLSQEPDLRSLPEAQLWGELRGEPGRLEFEEVDFSHPLWILYSSGTTGLPKAIVHGHGGILIEHLKALALQCDVGRGDRVFWFTSTGWMMWNFLVGSLLAGATAVLYDGAPMHPEADSLWDLAEEVRVTHFGVSASYIQGCMKANLVPGAARNLSSLRFVGSTGSPLPADGFDWVYRNVKADVWLGPVSGGTDICSGFVGSCPDLPVRAGEMQCRFLGAAVEAFDPAGHALTGEVGELVVTRPLPSMPLYFWGDREKERYRESYFDVYPGIWRHGDWIRIEPDGSCVIYGRSDATINRHGVRMGTSEIYRAVESLDEVADSLAVDLEGLGGRSFLPLFVVLRAGVSLDGQLKERIRTRVREAVSPRHVPDEIYQVPDIPRTLSGKKMEVPVRRILLGEAVEKAANRGSMANPESLDAFVRLARSLGPGRE